MILHELKSFKHRAKGKQKGTAVVAHKAGTASAVAIPRESSVPGPLRSR
jgi:hypothetical protein